VEVFGCDNILSLLRKHGIIFFIFCCIFASIFVKAAILIEYYCIKCVSTIGLIMSSMEGRNVQPLNLLMIAVSIEIPFV
jgi:hypothetical protein